MLNTLKLRKSGSKGKEFTSSMMGGLNLDEIRPTDGTPDVLGANSDLIIGIKTSFGTRQTK